MGACSDFEGLYKGEHAYRNLESLDRNLIFLHFALSGVSRSPLCLAAPNSGTCQENSELYEIPR